MTPKEFAVSYILSDGFKKRFENHKKDWIDYLLPEIMSYHYNPKLITKISQKRVGKTKIVPYASEYGSGVSYKGGDQNTIFLPKGEEEYLPHEFGHSIESSIVPYIEYDFIGDRKLDEIFTTKRGSLNGNPYTYSYPIFQKSKSYQAMKKAYPDFEKDRSYYYVSTEDGQYNGHDAAPSESYADLFQLRYDLNELGIFDSRTTNIFTQDHLNKFKKSKYYKRNRRIFDNFSDSDIITMMNVVAYNNQQNSQQNLYAKRGTKLIPKFK